MSILDKIFKKSPWDKYYTKEELQMKIPDISMYELLVECSKKYDKELAIDYFGKTISYRHLVELVDKCARAFEVEGITTNDVVTICMPNTPEALICVYAINKIGAIANMIHPLSGEEEIKNYLVSTNSKMLVMIDICYVKVKNVIGSTNVTKTIVVSAKDSMPFLMSVGYSFTQGYKIKKPHASDRYIYWNEFLLRSYRKAKNPGVRRGKEDAAIILHSGGTTGNPKGILLSNGNFNALALQARVVFKNIGPKDSVLVIMPNFHGFGLGVSMHAALGLGAKLILIPQFSAKTFDKLITKNKPSAIMGVPTLFEGLLGNTRMEKVDLSYVKYMISGGDTLSPSLTKRLNKFLKKHNATVKVLQGYGMTEALAAISLSYGKGYKPGSIGIPFPGNDFKIVIPGTREEVQPGETGEICVSGPTVMMGYLNNKKETNEVLQIHKDKKIWLHTGDGGHIDEDGILYFDQRLKRMIVSSGYNLYPSHMEEIIERHPAVLKCTVIGIPHKYKVQVAKAYIVLDEGYTDSWSTKKSIKEHCEKNMAAYSLPYEYEFRKSLPTTLLGKINYKKLEDENHEEE